MIKRCVNLPEVFIKKIEHTAKTKKITVSDYIRQLVDLGLQVEEAREKNNISSENNQEKIDEILLKVTIESVFILRQLLQGTCQLTGGKINDFSSDDILMNAKGRAKSFVEGLLNKEI